jgi:hypothetical protein
MVPKSYTLCPKFAKMTREGILLMAFLGGEIKAMKTTGKILGRYRTYANRLLF